MFNRHYIIIIFVLLFCTTGFAKDQTKQLSIDTLPASLVAPVPQANRILIKYREDVSDLIRSKMEYDHRLQKSKRIKQLGIDVFNVHSDDTAKEVIDRIKAKHKKFIEFIEVDEVLIPSLIPNDVSYSNQWHHPKISSPLAWDYIQGNNSVIIAILDTGVDSTHSDLRDRVIPGWNFYDNNSNSSDVYGHGTAVAGVAAASGNNAVGIAGVCWNCLIMPVRISDPAGYAYWSTVAQGLTWVADHGARVANISYQASGSQTISNAAQYFQSKGGVVTISAGNDGQVDLLNDNPYVLTISATDSVDNLASWSTRGNIIDVAAPGVSIFTTMRGGGYGSWSGTSFSAPMVAGVAALILSFNPALTSDQVQNIIKVSATDLGAVGWDQLYGWGRINVLNAVTLAQSTIGTQDVLPPTDPTNLVSAKIDAGHVYLNWNASLDGVGVAGYKIYRNSVEIGQSNNPSYTDSQVEPLTTYSYYVKAYDAAGNHSNMSNVLSVTTPEPVISLSNVNVSSKTTSSAIIGAQTNLPATVSVKYGTMSGNLLLTSSTTTLGTSHQIILSNLTRRTVYYYVVVAKDSKGNTISSNQSSFRTLNK